MVCLSLIVLLFIFYYSNKEHKKFLKEIELYYKNRKMPSIEVSISKQKEQFISDNPELRAKLASIKEGKITDCYIELSTEDLKKLDTFIHIKRPLNVIFYCKNDEQHFLFAEVDTGRDYYTKEGAEIIHEEYDTMKKIKYQGN